MMHSWFECKVRYSKTMENGTVKKVTEPYLVDALSFTEAEARIIEEVAPFISGEFTVMDIKRAHYSELFDQFGGDKYYDCKVQFVTIDEKTAKEKKTSTYIIVLANNLQEAMKNLTEGMKGTLADYNAVCIKETAIVDIYPFSFEKDEEDPEKVDNKKEEKSQVNPVEKKKESHRIKNAKKKKTKSFDIKDITIEVKRE